MNKKSKSGGKEIRRRVEIRKDLEDGEKGSDLSYLNEFPQFSVDEGVEAGIPPPREKAGEKSRTVNRPEK